MNTKKYIIAAGAIATLLGSGAMLVTAQTPGAGFVVNAHNSPMVFEVNANGKALMRGTVTAVSASSLTVKSWGGDWVVNTSSSTALTPGASLSQFAVGDFVGVQGTVSTTAAWTIDASLVRNWTIRATAQENKKEIKSLIGRNWEGVVVGDINADGSFKLKVGTTTYDIKMATGARIVDRGYFAISSSLIKEGDIVRVYGPAVDATITASVVRNTSYDLKKGTK